MVVFGILTVSINCLLTFCNSTLRQNYYATSARYQRMSSASILRRELHKKFGKSSNYSNYFNSRYLTIILRNLMEYRLKQQTRLLFDCYFIAKKLQTISILPFVYPTHESNVAGLLTMVKKCLVHHDHI